MSIKISWFKVIKLFKILNWNILFHLIHALNGLVGLGFTLRYHINICALLNKL